MEHACEIFWRQHLRRICESYQFNLVSNISMLFTEQSWSYLTLWLAGLIDVNGIGGTLSAYFANHLQLRQLYLHTLTLEVLLKMVRFVYPMAFISDS